MTMFELNAIPVDIPTPNGGRPTRDYWITLDQAHMIMINGTTPYAKAVARGYQVESTLDITNGIVPKIIL